MLIAYWIVYGILCTVHLIACFFNKDLLRKITKVMLLPVLSISLIITKTFDYPLIFAGLFFGWLGDVLLIFDRKKYCFPLGATFFAVGHLAYIITAMTLFLEKYGSIKNVQIWVYIVLSVVALLLAFFAIFVLRKYLGRIAYLGMTYFYILIIALIASFLAERYLLATGFIFFLTSDTILSLCRYKWKLKRPDFYIMSTYILAQTLICLSYILSL